MKSFQINLSNKLIRETLIDIFSKICQNKTNPYSVPFMPEVIKVISCEEAFKLFDEVLNPKDLLCSLSSGKKIKFSTDKTIHIPTCVLTFKEIEEIWQIKLSIENKT